MKINQISSAYGLEIQKATGNLKNLPKSEPTKKNDSVNFSKSGRELSAKTSDIESASSRIQSLPEIREDKISEVKKKMDEGYYQTPEFTEKLADRLIKDFGL